MTITEHITAVRREMAEAARESGRSERDIICLLYTSDAADEL